eukprot:15364412-Ditylum_brightwellii.AAC.2
MALVAINQNASMTQHTIKTSALWPASMRRYNAQVWREFWHNSRIKQLNSANPNTPEHTLEKQDQGLKTGLQSKATGHGPPDSTQLENFLKDIEKDLLRKAVFKNHQDEANATDNDKVLEECFQDLGKNAVQAVVSTDKTNAHQVIDLLDYTKWVEEHLKDNATEVK